MESACQRPTRGREPSVRYALGPEDPLRSREPAGAGVASRTEGVPPSHGAQRRSSRRCTPPRRTLVSCLSAPRCAGVGTSMEQVPNPLTEAAFQRPNRGRGRPRSGIPPETGIPLRSEGILPLGRRKAPFFRAIGTRGENACSLRLRTLAGRSGNSHAKAYASPAPRGRHRPASP